MRIRERNKQLRMLTPAYDAEIVKRSTKDILFGLARNKSEQNNAED